MNIERLKDLEELNRFLQTDPPPTKKSSALSKRSKIHAEFGLTDLALQDCVQAIDGNPPGTVGQALEQAQTILGGQLRPTPGSSPAAEPAEVPEYALYARLGEALRVYVRDVLFSETLADSSIMLEKILASIQAFDQAEEKLPPPEELSEDDQRRKWIKAHRGAAYSLQYWMLVTNNDPDADRVFRAAEEDFVQSSEFGGKRYVWSIRFHALLVTLRAAKGDFERARGLLNSVIDDAPLAQSSLHRSLSMLFSYETAAENLNQIVRRSASFEGVAAGGAAVEEDAEDHIAAYFTAANWWFLASTETDPAVKAGHLAAFQAAISSARIRARNSISQSLAGLVGLVLLDAFRSQAQTTTDFAVQELSDAQLKELQSLLGFLDSFPPDFETRLIFARDPVWTEVKLTMPAMFRQLQSAQLNFDKLEQKNRVVLKQRSV